MGFTAAQLPELPKGCQFTLPHFDETRVGEGFSTSSDLLVTLKPDGTVVHTPGTGASRLTSHADSVGTHFWTNDPVSTNLTPEIKQFLEENPLIGVISGQDKETRLETNSASGEMIAVPVSGPSDIDLSSTVILARFTVSSDGTVEVPYVCSGGSKCLHLAARASEN